MHVQAHERIEQLQRLRRLKSHRVIATRLQMVILAQRGYTAPQIAGSVDMSRRVVQTWVQRYNARGIDGLWDRARPGQPTKLPREQEQVFKQRMLDGPGDADGGLCTLRGRDAQRILTDEFDAHYSLGGAIELLHRLGFSCLKPRPRHRKNDPQAMTRWLEDSPLLSKN
jgi:putative transposase